MKKLKEQNTYIVFCTRNPLPLLLTKAMDVKEVQKKIRDYINQHREEYGVQTKKYATLSDAKNLEKFLILTPENNNLEGKFWTTHDGVRVVQVEITNDNSIWI